MQKWEYCMVFGVSIGRDGFGGDYPSIMYFKEDGLKVEKISGGSEVEGEKLELLIAKLGREGWELVSITPPPSGGYGHKFSFKRPIE